VFITAQGSQDRAGTETHRQVDTRLVHHNDRDWTLFDSFAVCDLCHSIRDLERQIGYDHSKRRLSIAKSTAI